MTNSNPRIAKIMPLEYYIDRLQPFLTNPLSRGSGRNRIDSAWRFGRRAYRTVARRGIELMMSSISERRKLLSRFMTHPLSGSQLRSAHPLRRASRRELGRYGSGGCALVGPYLPSYKRIEPRSMRVRQSILPLFLRRCHQKSRIMCHCEQPK
jgi:hypothetical protein